MGPLTVLANQSQPFKLILVLVHLHPTIFLTFRSAKKFFIRDYLDREKDKTAADASDAWDNLKKKHKKKWSQKFEAEREEFPEKYRQFILSLGKKDLELYSSLKKQEEEEAAKNGETSSESDSDSD